MALGSSIQSLSAPTRGYQTVAPVSMTSGWQTLIDAGGVTVQDAATITNPTTQITASTRHIFQRKSAGTNLILRMKYDDGLTTITSPVVKVFGRTGGGAWEVLKSRAAALTATLTATTATDSQDGTYSYTVVDFSTQAWDCLGCEEILVGIETALAATGTTSTATIEGKFI